MLSNTTHSRSGRSQNYANFLSPCVVFNKGNTEAAVHATVTHSVLVIVNANRIMMHDIIWHNNYI